MAVPFRRYFGRLFPKSIRPAIKARAFTITTRRFHGQPRVALQVFDDGETGRLAFNGTTVLLPQPFASIEGGWLAEHAEDVLEIEAFLKLAPHAGGLMLDVGAHVGTFAALFGKASAHDVLCFEPVPRSQNLIEQTVALNGLDGRVQVIPVAVSDRLGEIEMHIDPVTGFALAQNYEATAGAMDGTLRVPTTTIDALRSETSKPIGMIKIDVEGFEAEVLAGAPETLRRDRPLLAVEIHHDYLRERGVSPARVLRTLESSDYALLRLNGKRMSARAAARSFLPRAHVLAVPRERRDECERILRGSGR